MTYNGALSASQIITIFDNLAAIFDASYSSMGLGASTESGTASLAAATFKTALLGDGNAIPGIGNVFAADHQVAIDALLQRFRWDTTWASVTRPFLLDLDSQLGQQAPAGWNLSGPTSLHQFNSHLLRMNGCHVGVPATPGSAGTLTAVNDPTGTLPNFGSGSCPFIVHTLGGLNDWDESLPSPEAAPISLSGSNNALQYQIAGNAPAGNYFVRVYRGYVAGLTTIWFYDQKVVVTPGSPYPAILIAQPDALLDTNWRAPAWLSCLLKPSAATPCALAYAVSAASRLVPGIVVPLTDASMLSPSNVVLGPSNKFFGPANTVQSGLFGTTTIGTGFVAGAIQNANNAGSRTQGFAGATKLQARITALCNAVPTVNAIYSYLEAANGQTLQTGGTTSATFSSTAVGTILALPVTAGRLVRAVTADAPSGAASGAYVIEAAPAR